MIDRAFIDESIRMSADGYVYVLAAVSPTLRTSSLVPLRRVLLPGQRYVHWRDETNERRAVLVDAFNTMAFDVAVAVMERVPNRGQEWARAACMLALVSEFDRGPGVRWEIEGRRQHLDQRDMDTIHNAHRGGELSKRADAEFREQVGIASIVGGGRGGPRRRPPTSLDPVDPITGDRCGSRDLSCSL